MSDTVGLTAHIIVAWYTVEQALADIVTPPQARKHPSAGTCQA
jgi:hypothetical protein